METKTKPLWKTLIFWELCITVLVVAALAVYLGIELSKPVSQPTEPSGTTQQTDPTLPPPAANPFTAQDFTYEDGYMTCLAMDTVLGIDVSEWQKEIDWEQVKAAGIDYVMIRFARRGTTEGLLYEDAYARANYEGARQAGLKVGGYIFSQAVSVEEAEEEANFLLDMIKDFQIDMPIVYDWEYVDAQARTANTDARTVTDCALAFCRIIGQAGYEPMIYFNENQSLWHLYLEELTDYRFWLAKYADTMDYPYRVDMWQYTDTGTVPGISRSVDVNLYFPYG